MSDDAREPAPHADPDLTREPARSGAAHDLIGPYRLLQKVGEGGMGVVWLARADRAVPAPGRAQAHQARHGPAQVIARFEAERQALALMDHPSIARVFDAGTTPNGRPYFVMEYVEGVPITSYCDRSRLSAGSAWSCSCRCATACSTRTRRASFIAT